MKITEDDLNKLFDNVRTEEPEHLLKTAVSLIDGKIGLACSFSMEDLILVEIIARNDLPIEIFALDTGRLNEETYFCAEQARLKYQIEIQWFFPHQATTAELERSKGLYSFKESIENRKECCRIRKIEPLKRALAPLDAWITGQRKAQSVTRANLEHVEFDHGNRMAKLNPLASWTLEQVVQYTQAQQIPKNKLYEGGYTSIGCAPCTRAIAPGEDERAGRWWWENPEHKECGLHLVNDLKLVNRK